MATSRTPKRRTSSKSKSAPARDLYQEVTDRVLAALEAGTVPWRRPWSHGADTHRNALTGVAYRNINPVLLEMTAVAAGYTDRRWVTFRQAQKLGGSVRRGQSGTTLVFFRRNLVEDPEGRIVRRGKTYKMLFLLRHFSVFNVEQCEGLNLREEETPEPFEPLERCEEVLAGYLDHDGGPSLGFGGDSACYAPGADHIQMPDPSAFAERESYYAVLFHEAGHSTGHASRLARADLGAGAFGSKSYAREELTAELTAAMLCGWCAIAAERIDQVAAYVDDWRQKLTDDPRCVLIAASRAQHAADWILGRTEVHDDEEAEGTPASVALATA